MSDTCEHGVKKINVCPACLREIYGRHSELSAWTGSLYFKGYAHGNKRQIVQFLRQYADLLESQSEIEDGHFSRGYGYDCGHNFNTSAKNGWQT